MLLLPVLLLQFLPVASSPIACALRRHPLNGYYKDGDLIIGGIIQFEFAWETRPGRRLFNLNFGAHLSFEVQPGLTTDSMTSKYLLPRQISYGTMTPVFNVTHRLPSFYQAAANELSEIDAIVQMLKHFAWKWVGILVSDDDTGQIAGDTFKKEIASSGGCVAFFITLEEDAFEFPETVATILETINKSSANVTVVFLNVKFADTFAHVFAKPKLRPIIWITSSYFIRILELQRLKIGTTFDGTLSLSAHQGDIPGFRDYFYSIKPINFPDDKLMGEVWKRLVLQNISSPTSSAVPKCIGNETLNEAYFSLLNVFEYRTSYIVYTTIYTMAHSLHDMFATSKSKNLQNCFQHWRKCSSRTLTADIGGLAGKVSIKHTSPDSAAQL
ncbi:vomeronasal type-2 receptor [Pristimantis euphronides]